MVNKGSLIPGLLLVLLCVALMAGPAGAQEHTLYQIDRTREEGRTLFQLVLSAVPEYEVKTSGQRLDVILFHTGVAQSLEKLEAGGELARTLLAEQGTKTIVSLVLRRPPADVEYSTADGESALRLRVSWPEEDPRSRPAMAGELRGKISLGPEGVSLTRRMTSAYQDNWRDFFREYEPPLRIEPDLVYTLPPFPGFFHGRDLEALPEKPVQLAQEGDWGRALAVLDRLPPEDFTNRERLLAGLLRADLLLRQKKMEKGRRILRGLTGQGHSEYAGVLGFLGAYAAAAAGNPYLGFSRAQDVSFSEETPRQWKTYGRLLKIETALGSGHAETAYALASDMPGEDFPDLRIFALRKAQAAFVLGKRERAIRDLESFPRAFLRKHPRSLAQLARYNYENGNYGASLQIYSRLANALTDPERIALARFGEAMSDLHRGARVLARVSLARLVKESGDVRAKWRAKTELTDLKVLNDKDPDPSALAESYHHVSQRAENRAIREEAAFKRILVAYLFDHQHTAVQWLGPFLRDFAAGELRSHARVLLVDILPGVVRDLLDQDAYIRAMALVQRHSQALRSVRLPLGFLYDLGGAFTRLGFYNRACRVYEYMMTLSGDPEKREDIYPHLVRCYLRQEEYVQAVDSARNYVEEYPEGKHEKTVYSLLAQSLQKSGRTERAAALLRSPDRPVSRKLDSLAGRILFRLGRFGEAERYLARATSTRWRKASPELLLLRAECLYRTGFLSQALPVYSFLEHEGYRKGQVRYRMGQIRMRTGREGQGTKLWQRTADTKESPLWGDLASEGLAIRALKKEHD